MLRKTLEARGYSRRRGGRRLRGAPAPPGARASWSCSPTCACPRAAASTCCRPRARPTPQTPVIVMTAFGTVEEAVRAMKEGAADFLTKPVDTEHLLLLLDRAIERRRAARPSYVLLKEDYQRRFGLPRVLGEDPALQGDDAGHAARGGHRRHGAAPGRERHRQGADEPRAAPALARAPRGPSWPSTARPSPRPCWRTSCSATRRAPSPAPPARKVGKAELAHRGTLFLDEIGDLPLAAAGQDPAPRAGEAVRARGRRADAQRGRAGGGGHQPRPARGGGAEAVPRGPVLPPLGVPGRDPAAAPAPRRHPRSWPRRSSSATRARWGGKGLRLSEAAQRALARRTPGPATCASCRTAWSARPSCATASEIEPAHLRLGRRLRGGPSLADVLDLSGPLADVRERAAERAEEEAIALALRDANGDRAAAAASASASASRRSAGACATAEES